MKKVYGKVVIYAKANEKQIENNESELHTEFDDLVQMLEFNIRLWNKKGGNKLVLEVKKQYEEIQ